MTQTCLRAFQSEVFAPLPSDVEGTCTSIEGCPALGKSYLAFEKNIKMISKVPFNISILILNGENDSTAW